MGEKIWVSDPDLAGINRRLDGTLASVLGIEFVEIGDDYLAATMPVDDRTRQPYGLLHGGATAALAETLGSVGGIFCVDLSESVVVGLEINANHIRSVRDGVVRGTAWPLHLGRTTQVWRIRVEDLEGQLVSACRLTLAVRPSEGRDPP